MKYIVTLLSVFFIFSCNNQKQNAKDTVTTFGGEIKNPKSNLVLLYKDDKIVDTLHLNKKNRFLNTYTNLKEGLYTFKHGVEFQYIYLEPNDSILVRLNTWDFDESLVFNGRGSNKNEFLINLYLQNEREEKAMYQFFSLKETNFSTKLDSLKKLRLTIFKDFEKTEPKLTSGFKQLTNAAIYYPIYRLKEIYPYYHKKQLKLDKYPVISKSFYNFRKKIDINKSELLPFYPYQNYIVSHLHNLSTYEQEKNSDKKDIILNLIYNIANKITIPSFKNTLLKTITINSYLENNIDTTSKQKRLDVFFKECDNEIFKKEVKNLIEDTKALKKGTKLSNFNLTTSKGTATNLFKELHNKNSVIYFWSEEHMSPEYLSKRITFLEKKYPNVNFVGVHIDKNCSITQNPYLKNFNPKLLFRVADNKPLPYLKGNYPRAIVLKKDKTIVTGFTQIYNSKIETILNNLN